LRISHEVYDMAVQATKDVIRDYTIPRQQIKWEPSLSTIYGYELNNMESNPEWFYEHIHPEDRETVKRNLNETINHSGTHWEEEYRFLSANGSYKYVL